MFITQELKNKQMRRRREKRVSEIMAEANNFEKKRRKQSIPLFLRKEVKSSMLNRQIQKKLKVFNQNAQSRFNFFPQELQQFEKEQQQQINNTVNKKKNFHIKNKLSKQDLRIIWPSSNINRNKSMPHQEKLCLWKGQDQSRPNLRNENIKKLQMFIKGAYHSQLDEYSQFVNLSSLDSFRKDFYIFDSIYRWTSQANQNQKMSISDVRSQNLKDIVYLNDQKQNTGMPELTGVMKRYKIVQ